jgi:DNA-binding transcriptional MerR regulator
LEKTTWKVGELAGMTGITIRALHHYHEKGLLIPSGMNEAGYRIYSKDDIIRLQQIISLKQFGFNLGRIKQILERKDYDPVKIIQTQLNVVEKQIKIQQKLKFQLETILLVLSNQAAKTEDFIKLIGALAMSKNDLFTKDQVEELISKSQSTVNGLDPKGIIEIRELLRKLAHDEGITLLISSHLLDELSRVAMRYGIIEQGNIIKQMAADELPSTQRLEDYFMNLIGGAK